MKALNESRSLRFFTFSYLYVMQGLPAGFALTAMANFLIGNNVPPHYVSTFIAAVGLPWMIQFIWGPILDRYQYSKFGLRKHWVVLSQVVAVIASAGLLVIHDPVAQLTAMGALFFVHSIFASIQDASVDALAISIVPADERGRLNGAMRGGYLAGMGIGSAFLSWVLHEYGFSTAAFVQTMILLAFTVVTFFIKVDRNDVLLPGLSAFRSGDKKVAGPALASIFKRIYQGITSKNHLQYFLIIAMVYLCMSIFIRTFTFHLIHELSWTDRSVSFLQGIWGTAITFATIILGGIISDKMGAQKLQIRVMWGIAFFLFTINAISSLWQYEIVSGIGLALWNLADPLFSVAAFPILMAICSEKIEGSQFTAYMAIINFCDVLGSYVGGWAIGTVPPQYMGILCGIFILFLISQLKKQVIYYPLPR